VAHQLKIGIYQSINEYPSLHVMVTKNARYLKERMVCSTVEEAMTKIEDWLRRKMK
jgi:hypothetical protein